MIRHSRFAAMSTMMAVTVFCYVSANAGEFISLYSGSNNFSVMKDERVYLSMGVGGWGANWSWLGWKANPSYSDTSLSCKGTAKHFTVVSDYKPTSRGFTVSSTLTSTKDDNVTLIMIGAGFPGFSKGSWKATGAGGKELQGKMPLGRGALDECGKVKSISLIDNDGETCVFSFDPAIIVHSDGGQMRMVLAEGQMQANKKYSFSLDVTLPGKSVVYTDPSKAPGTKDFDQWYAFKGTGHPKGQSYLDMGDWSKDPAGKLGHIKIKKDRLYYGKNPIKLWGLNVCYGSCAPKKELAEQRAALYKSYGINAARLHKFADGSGWQGILKKDDATQFDPDGLDRMDYFVAKLKEAGVYIKLSPIFYVKPKAKNRSDVPYFDEFQNRGGTAQTGGGAMYLGKELQDLQIQQMTNFLKHKNPYTGMTYAEDPVVSTVEITNEDSVLFFSTLRAMQTSKTLKKRSGELFAKWLKAKYGSKEKLLAAWGNDMLGNFRAERFPKESWEKDQIYPVGNPWFYSPAQLEGSQKPRKARLLDTIAFLSDLQGKVYQRMAEGIRKAGYKGPLIASNWQAGEGTSHYANLYCDAKIGIVDRHNYFGGGSPQLIKNTSMLATPGSGTLSSSFQQVQNRPFMVSEWIHCMPNEWGVEGPAIIGAYGMGLQGWDVSYMFQNQDPGTFMSALQTSRNRVWNVAVPQILGSFPAVSRMVRRGDVSEAKHTYTLNVNLPSLLKGGWTFRDTTQQAHDTKSFTTDVAPTEALAVSRVAVDFTDDKKPTPPFDFASYKQGDAYHSDTGQLTWYKGHKPMDGYFTVDTDATAAVCGFAEGKSAKLKSAKISPKTRFASIFVTARSPKGTLLSDKQVLITAIARCRNQGANYLMDKIINDFGRKNGPIVMEPVKAEIAFRRTGDATVYILDHDGVKTGKTIPWNGGKLDIDTARDQTPYYLIEYQ